MKDLNDLLVSETQAVFFSAKPHTSALQALSNALLVLLTSSLPPPQLDDKPPLIASSNRLQDDKASSTLSHDDEDQLDSLFTALIALSHRQRGPVRPAAKL